MKTSRPQKRSGFSLVELLVVIAIITLLASLIAFTLPNIMSSANDAATKATIKKVNELLNKRMHALTREIQDQDRMAVGGAPSYLINSPFASVTPREKALVLARKHFIRLHLPMTFAEAEAAPTVTSSHTAATENAEMLYYFLTNGPQFDAAPVDTDTFRSTELADTDGDGALEIVDAWGKPLRFYRWPTRLIRPAPSGSEATPQTITNPSEPNPNLLNYQFEINPAFSGAGFPTEVGATARLLMNSIELAPLNVTRGPGTDFQHELGDPAANIPSDPLARDPDDPLGLIHPTTDIDATNIENNLHTPDTWHTPLVVSAGRDGVLGLFEPLDTTNRGHLAQPVLTPEGIEGLLDNLTNRQE